MDPLGMFATSGKDVLEEADLFRKMQRFLAIGFSEQLYIGVVRAQKILCMLLMACDVSHVSYHKA